MRGWGLALLDGAVSATDCMMGNEESVLGMLHFRKAFAGHLEERWNDVTQASRLCHFS